MLRLAPMGARGAVQRAAARTTLFRPTQQRTLLLRKSSSNAQTVFFVRAMARRVRGGTLAAATVYGYLSMASSRSSVAVCEEVAVEPTAEAIMSKMEELEQARAKTWVGVWREIFAHWLSFGTLTLATFVSTVVERVMLAGQVQQLMQLPGQMSLDALLTQIGVVFSIKAVQLIAEVVRAALATRLGEKIERETRSSLVEVVRANRALGDPETLAMGPDELRAVARDLGAARRVVTTEAAPRVIVEGIYGVVSAVGALTSSAPLAVYFVAHEGLVSQVVGFAGAMLAQRRDGYMAQAETAREEWEIAAWKHVIDADHVGDDSALEALASLEAKSAIAQAYSVSFGDAHAVVERTMDASQLVVLSSFVASAAALVDRNVLGVDGPKYQKVMGFASNAMQAAGETSGAAEKFGRASEILSTYYRLENNLNAHQGGAKAK